MSKKRDRQSKDTRPPIQRRDLERQVAEAGRKAVVEAGGKPADPKVLVALAGTGRPDVIAGIDIHQPALNALVAWEQWLASKAAKTATPVTMLAATAYAYLRPDEAIEAMKRGDDVMLDQTRDFSRELDVPALKKITLIIRAHIADLFGDINETPADAKKNTPAKTPKPSLSGRRK